MSFFNINVFKRVFVHAPTISEMSSNKYRVLSKTLRRIKHRQQASIVHEVWKWTLDAKATLSYMVELSGSEQELKNLYRHATTFIYLEMIRECILEPTTFQNQT
jgi:hypothetical protein